MKKSQKISEFESPFLDDPETLGLLDSKHSWRYCTLKNNYLLTSRKKFCTWKDSIDGTTLDFEKFPFNLCELKFFLILYFENFEWLGDY